MITLLKNDNLIKEVTNKEIKKALFDMYLLKAPGIDSMTLFFLSKVLKYCFYDVLKLWKVFST